MAKILIVEDDKELSVLLADTFKSEHHNVDVVNTGGDAVEYLKASAYDAVILDRNLPEVDGLEICRRMRAERNNVPIIMLTGKSTTLDKLTGLDSGADDYVTKPFEVEELVARVRAVLRRSANQTANALQMRGIVLDPVKHSVIVQGEEVALLPIEFSLLEFFMRHPDQVFSHDALLRRVWPTDSDSTSEAVRSCMKRLRKKINDESDPAIIETIYGVGYRMNSKG